MRHIEAVLNKARSKVEFKIAATLELKFETAKERAMFMKCLHRWTKVFIETPTLTLLKFQLRRLMTRIQRCLVQSHLLQSLDKVSNKKRYLTTSLSKMMMNS